MKNFESKTAVKYERQRGFTLVEVILVVAIMTIISAIAVPQVGKYLNKANKSKLMGAVVELNNAATTWSMDNNGNMPENLNEVFAEYGNLQKLGIGLDESGSFTVGNIKGIIVLDSGEVYAQISEDSKAYSGEILRR